MSILLTMAAFSEVPLFWLALVDIDGLLCDGDTRSFSSESIVLCVNFLIYFYNAIWLDFQLKNEVFDFVDAG